MHACKILCIILLLLKKKGKSCWLLSGDNQLYNGIYFWQNDDFFKKRIKTNNLGGKIERKKRSKPIWKKTEGNVYELVFISKPLKEQAEPNVWVKKFRENWVCKHNQKCHKRERKGLIIQGHKIKQPGHQISLNSFTCYSSCRVFLLLF